MPVQSIISHGSLQSLSYITDEPNLLVNSLSRNPSREKREYKNADGATAALRFVNPMMTFGFDCYITALSGLANQHPGTAVVSLSNYAAPQHGFDPTEGTMIYEDPNIDTSNSDNQPRIRFNVVQYPFVITA